MKVMYRVPAPYNDGMIEVYGDPENAWYEWRILADERIVQDTGVEARQYGQAEIALRDALMVASGLEDGYTTQCARSRGPGM